MSGNVSGGIFGHGNLLIAGVKITAYNHHCSAPFSEPWSSTATKFTRGKEPATSSNQPGPPFTIPLYDCSQLDRHSSRISSLSWLDSMERMAAMSLVE